MNEPTPDEHRILVDAIHDSATVIHKGQRMNDRIRQLADQAELTIRTGIGTYMSHPEFNKKFAELIVQECVRHFNDDYQRDFDTLWREDLSKSIKEHFGIKE